MVLIGSIFPEFVTISRIFRPFKYKEPAMKKHLFSLLFFMLLTSAFSQQAYQEAQDKNGNFALVGHIGVEQLKTETFKEWYDVFYEYHELDQTPIETFATELKKHHVLVFMGTWCSDSQREVPAFVKILEAAQFPMDQLKIVAVHDRGPLYKTSPNGEQWGLQIKRVPTFIFLKDGRETNRIVESPVESLEEDILQILTGQDYVPNYAELMKSK